MVPRVAIVIVNWNGAADTLECLESLAQDRYPNKTIIVVDNGSIDDSCNVIRGAFPEVTILETHQNLGFTGGNNIGIMRAFADGADYVFLLNNDTISDPATLSLLIQAANNDSSFGLLSPVIFYFEDPEQPWFSGSRIDWQSGSAMHVNDRVPKQKGEVVEIPWASGCAMLISREVMEGVRGFDERFFLNWEDVDLSLRIRARGKKIGLVAETCVLHKVSRSFKELQALACYYHVRNNLLILRLYAGANRLRGTFAVLSTRSREALRAVRRGKSIGWRLMTMTIRACVDDYRGRYGRFEPAWLWKQ